LNDTSTVGVKAGADPSDCYPEISNVPASGRLWPRLCKNAEVA